MTYRRFPVPTSLRVPVRTQYFHFDQQGVVFNMWYLAFAEEARNAYLDTIGYPLQELEDSGHDIQVVHTSVDWSGAVRYRDDIEIEVSTTRVGNSSLALEYSLQVAGQERVKIRGVYVIVDAAISGKKPLPARLRAALEASIPGDERVEG